MSADQADSASPILLEEPETPSNEAVMTVESAEEILAPVIEHPIAKSVFAPATLDALIYMRRTAPRRSAEIEKQFVVGEVTKSGLAKALKQRAADQQQIDVDADYPLKPMPGGVVIGVVKKGKDGFKWVVHAEKGYLFSALAPVATVRFHDGEEPTFGLRVALENADCQRVELDIDAAFLSGRDKSAIIADLRERGWRGGGQSEEIVLDILRTARPNHTINVVKRTGLHRIGEKNAFACPTGDIVGEFDGELSATARSFFIGKQKRGSLSGWQSAVSQLAKIDNVPHWMFSLLTAFAGPLVAITSAATPMLNLNGGSSTGKTTGMFFAGSVWGTPTLGRGLLRPANSTANAIEKVAAAASGSWLGLDELGQMESPDKLGAFIFKLNGGVAKSRMKSDGSLRDGAAWNTIIMFSLEKPVADFVRTAGGTWVMGNDTRLYDVRVDGLNTSVARAVIDAIKASFAANCGHAGPEFVAALYANGWFDRATDINDEINKRIQRLCTSMDGAKARLAAIPALIWLAADLASEFGILPGDIDINEAIEWAHKNANSEAVGADELRDRAVHNFLGNLTRMKGRQIEFKTKSQDHVAGIGMKSGGHEVLGHYNEGDPCIWLHRKALVKLSESTMSEKTLVEELTAKGILLKNEKEGRDIWRYAKTFGKGEFYKIDAVAPGYFNNVRPAGEDDFEIPTMIKDIERRELEVLRMRKDNENQQNEIARTKSRMKADLEELAAFRAAAAKKAAA